MPSGIAGSPQIERFRKAWIQRNRTIQTLNGIRMATGITVFSRNTHQSFGLSLLISAAGKRDACISGPGSMPSHGQHEAVADCRL